MKELSRVQQLHLDLLRTVSFNELDGARVADDLLARRDLWEACFLDRIGWAYPHITAYDSLSTTRSRITTRPRTSRIAGSTWVSFAPNFCAITKLTRSATLPPRSTAGRVRLLQMQALRHAAHAS